MIRYTDQIDRIVPGQLGGFFEGWPNPPSAETHLRLLRGSDEVVLALEEESGNVVGFVTAISDGVLAAYVPLIEVLPGYRRRGIGRELLRRVFRRLDGLYMIDLLCDPWVRPFYKAAGMQPAAGMMIRNHECQSGRIDAGGG